MKNYSWFLSIFKYRVALENTLLQIESNHVYIEKISNVLKWKITHDFSRYSLMKSGSRKYNITDWVLKTSHVYIEK